MLCSKKSLSSEMSEIKKKSCKIDSRGESLPKAIRELLSFGIGLLLGFPAKFDEMDVFTSIIECLRIFIRKSGRNSLGKFVGPNIVM